MGLPIGNAGFKYPSGTPTTTVNLQAPVRERVPTDRERVTQETSWDLSVTEFLTFGSTEVRDMRCTLRYINNPRAVLDMLMEMANGVLAQYHEDVSGAADATNIQLVEPKADEITLPLDRDLGKWGRYEVTVLLRRTDGGDFDTLLAAGA